MTVRISGDFSKLQKLSAALKVNRIEQFSKMSSLAVRKLTLDSAQSEQDPYGNPWPAAPHRTGARTLFQTGAMIGGIVGFSTSRSIGLRSKPRYAWYHQNGATLRGKRLRVMMSGPMQDFRVLKNGKVVRPRRKWKTLPVSGKVRGRLPRRAFLPWRNLPSKWDDALNYIADLLIAGPLKGF